MIDAQAPDLLVLDLLMPGQGGLEVLEDPAFQAGDGGAAGRRVDGDGRRGQYPCRLRVWEQPTT